jgi:hypothetical protein
MGYGKLLGKQEEAVKALVQGKDVCDLGAGDMELSVKLLDLGAKNVLAVDKEDYPVPDDRIVRILSYYANVGRHVSELPKIALVSWPINHMEPSLPRLLGKFPYVIYLGKNTDMTACGSSTMFQFLLPREVLAYIPNKKNVLIIYGPRRVEREPYGEELAAITSDERSWDYEEVEEAARVLQKK